MPSALLPGAVLVAAFGSRIYTTSPLPPLLLSQLPAASGRSLLYLVVVVVKVNIARPLPVVAHKVSVAWRPLVLRVAGQHALEAHAHALDVLHGAPSLRTQQIEADDAIRVYVRMDRDRPVGQLEEDDLWRLCTSVSRWSKQHADLRKRQAPHNIVLTDRVGEWESEPQPVGLVEVEGILVKNADIGHPFFEVVWRDKLDTGGKAGVIHLYQVAVGHRRGPRVRDCRRKYKTSTQKGDGNTHLVQLLSKPLG